MDSWILYRNITSDAYRNMAIDETLLESTLSGEIKLPVLRFYSWTCPSISIGRNQDIRKDIVLARCEQDGIPIVRRPTGGRAVFHDHELTYCIVLPSSYPLAMNGIQDSYCSISKAFISGLEKLGIPAKLEKQQSGNKKYADEISCFSATIKYEVTLHGSKIIGSAQMRRQGAVLQQGSILFSSSEGMKNYFVNGTNSQKGIFDLTGKFLESDRVEDSLLSGFRESMRIDFQAQTLSEEFLIKVDNIKNNKYLTPEWLYYK